MTNSTQRRLPPDPFAVYWAPESEGTNIAWVSNDRAELVKLYPEQDITVRFKKRGHGTVYAYCNRDGLFSRRL